ncbi:ImmA/IrrE family metallo-endopeptidase [Haloarculaceae archaeon H-GB1-1]|nr:ImmA/IrrE family metallo-endopeptidase [Haloarculaceae archaeon H-GB1-1]
MTHRHRERVGFDDADTRADEMHSTFETWFDDLRENVAAAQTSEQFREWLDVQSRFHDYSHRNTLLITLQCPDATNVAGYRTWQQEFDRHVAEGESAIWIWAPIIVPVCPSCETSKKYHVDEECDDDTPQSEWSDDLVGFRPVPVFDISQTEGEPLPELDTTAHGDAERLLPTLRAIADDLGVTVRTIAPSEWDHGDARGVCLYDAEQPTVELRDRANEADLATTLVHEYAHALLHGGIADSDERAKREVEAEAVAYVVGRHFGLDTSNSAFYLAAWADADVETLQERLGRIQSTASRVIDAVEDAL